MHAPGGATALPFPEMPLTRPIDKQYKGRELSGGCNRYVRGPFEPPGRMVQPVTVTAFPVLRCDKLKNHSDNQMQILPAQLQ